MGDQIMVVWRRLGKEHGEGEGFRLNSPDVVKRHLSEKIERFRPERRWHRVSDNVIVEKADPSGAGFGEDTWIYYLQAQRWAVIENHTGDPEWPWYVHIGSTVYETDLKGWVFTDHFADVIVKDDGVSHSVLDLDDLARGLELGLVSGSTGSEILRQTQSLVDTIREGRFPPGELSEREAWKCELSHLRG